MAAPKTTIWDIEPHTMAKHEILRRYMQAWMPILGRSGFEKIVYIDGFAGPGRYSNGENGSPIIALKTALEHKTPITSEVWFLFVEQDKDRAGMLKEILGEISTPLEFSGESI